jgi:hypothetical protein
VHFKGILNDYSPSTVSGGPYEIRGVWSLDVAKTETASFSADLTMETTDYGITNATAVDPANPATRSPHTHHITMTNVTVSSDVRGRAGRQRLSRKPDRRLSLRRNRLQVSRIHEPGGERNGDDRRPGWSGLPCR